MNAQVKEIGEISLGKKFAIESTILNQTKEIQVYVPESYRDSIKQEYPVLYLLDGQRFFTNGVAIQKSLISPIALPEMLCIIYYKLVKPKKIKKNSLLIRQAFIIPVFAIINITLGLFVSGYDVVTN